jgi:tetratricopeptide (TPR) repeat protein
MLPHRICVTAALSVLIPAVALSAEALPRAVREPVAASAQQQADIDAGVALHDAMKFAEAIATYRRVLDANPDAIEALYELSFTLAASGDHAASLDVARRGAAYKSKFLPNFHQEIGNALDELGRANEALDVYKDAIKQSPGFGMLHFNLGVAQARRERVKDAVTALQQAAVLMPFHAGTHFLLAQLYEARGYRLPAVLAYSHFLLIEPESTRADRGRASLGTLLVGNVSTSSENGKQTIQLSLPRDTPKDEGDFGPAEATLAIAAAGALIKDGGPSNPFERVLSSYTLLGAVLEDVKPKGFAARFYAPFFAATEKRELTGALAYIVWRGQQLDGAESWAERNGDKVKAFGEWIRAYTWPASR